MGVRLRQSYYPGTTRTLYDTIAKRILRTYDQECIQYFRSSEEDAKCLTDIVIHVHTI